MKPTKARIELMQAISDGWVNQHFPLTGGAMYSVRDFGPGSPRRYRRVTAAMSDLRTAGLCKLPYSRLGDYRPITWELIPVGEAWLKANGGSTS